jgi:hypothetical protein
VSRASLTLVGGTTVSASNLIAFNRGNGVLVSGASTDDTMIETDTINANAGNGVYVYEASASSVLGCVIETNQRRGILISGTASTYNAYNTIVKNVAGSIGSF